MAQSMKSKQLAAEMERQTALRLETQQRETAVRAKETKMQLQKTVNYCYERIDSCSEAMTMIEDLRFKRQVLFERRVKAV